MKAPLCRVWCGSFPLIYTGLYRMSLGYFCVGRIQGATTPPPPNIPKNWCNIHSETIFSRLNVCILSKGVCGVYLRLKGGVFWWFGKCFSSNFWGIFNHLAIESPGDLMGKHSETSFLWRIASSRFMYPLATTSIGSADINGTGFHFILIFSHPSLFLAFSPSSPIFSYVPSHSLQPLPPSSPLPSYMYPVHPSSPHSSAGCRGRHWTVNLTPD